MRRGEKIGKLCATNVPFTLLETERTLIQLISRVYRWGMKYFSSKY